MSRACRILVCGSSMPDCRYPRYPVTFESAEKTTLPLWQSQPRVAKSPIGSRNINRLFAWSQSRPDDAHPPGVVPLRQEMAKHDEHPCVPHDEVDPGLGHAAGQGECTASQCRGPGRRHGRHLRRESLHPSRDAAPALPALQAHGRRSVVSGRGQPLCGAHRQVPARDGDRVDKGPRSRQDDRPFAPVGCPSLDHLPGRRDDQRQEGGGPPRDFRGVHRGETQAAPPRGRGAGLACRVLPAQTGVPRRTSGAGGPRRGRGALRVGLRRGGSSAGRRS